MVILISLAGPSHPSRHPHERVEILSPLLFAGNLVESRFTDIDHRLHIARAPFGILASWHPGALQQLGLNKYVSSTLRYYLTFYQQTGLTLVEVGKPEIDTLGSFCGPSAREYPTPLPFSPVSLSPLSSPPRETPLPTA